MPKIIASVVIRIGRSRTWPASQERLVQRCARRAARWLAKSTSRIAFFVTRPISMMKPMIEKMLSVVPVNSSASSTPISDSGSDTMIASGCSEAAELRREHQVDEDHREAERRQRRR